LMMMISMVMMGMESSTMNLLMDFYYRDYEYVHV
jgi:hypothetical protein